MEAQLMAAFSVFDGCSDSDDAEDTEKPSTSVASMVDTGTGDGGEGGESDAAAFCSSLSIGDMLIAEVLLFIDAGFVQLAGLHLNLVCRHWRSIIHSEASILSCLHFDKVPSVGVTDDAVIKLLMAYPHKQAALASLVLRNCPQISDKTVLHLATHCRSLSHLDLGNCAQVTGSAMRLLLPNLRNLTRLALGGLPSVDNRVVNSIVRRSTNKRQAIRVNDTSSALLSLDIGGGVDGSAITDNALRLLSTTQRHLRKLNITGCRNVTDATLISFVENCRDLVDFRLGNCRKIRSLGFAKKLLSSGAESGSHSQNAEVALWLGGCERITDTSLLDALVSPHAHAPLTATRRLTLLSLVGCRRVTAAAVAAVLEQHPHLRHINLGHTILDDSLVQQSSSLSRLVHSGSLEHLDLWNCYKLSKLEGIFQRPPHTQPDHHALHTPHTIAAEVAAAAAAATPPLLPTPAPSPGLTAALPYCRLSTLNLRGCVRIGDAQLSLLAAGVASVSSAMATTASVSGGGEAGGGASCGGAGDAGGAAYAHAHAHTHAHALAHAGAGAWGAAASLRVLDLADTSVTSAGALGVARACSTAHSQGRGCGLESLHLGGTAPESMGGSPGTCSDADIAAICAACKATLQGLEITYCLHLTDHALGNLRRCSKLKGLNLEGCEAMGVDIELDKSQRIRYLNVAATNITTEALLGMVKRNGCRLLSLHIQTCPRLSPDTLKNLCRCSSNLEYISASAFMMNENVVGAKVEFEKQMPYCELHFE